MEASVGGIYHKDACTQHHFQHSHSFANKLILNVLFSKPFLQYQMIVVNEYSGIKDSHFEPIRSDLE